MSNEQLEEKLARALDNLSEHESSWGTNPQEMPKGQAERRERLLATVRNAQQAIEDQLALDKARAEKIEAIKEAAKDPRNVTRGTNLNVDEPVVRHRSNPFNSGAGDDILRMDSPAGLAQRAQDAVEFSPLHHDAREKLSVALDQDPTPEASALVLGGLDPHYRSAFDKVLRDPARGHLLWTEAEREAFARVSAVRASLSHTDANGGFLVPLSLDPTVISTELTKLNPLRALATVRTTLTDQLRLVKSAGVTSSWVAENTAISDASPTFSSVDVNVHKLASYVTASYEIFQDSSIASQLPRMLAESKFNAEADAFVTGSGSGAPYGIATQVAAVTASRVSTTTAGTFGLPDLWAVHQAVPAQSRRGARPALVAHIKRLDDIRQFDTAGGSSLWQTLGDSTPDTVLGYQVVESPAMDSTVTTGDDILLLGDLSKFTIVDRVGMVIEPVQNVVNGDGVPTGTRGWIAWSRVGSQVIDENAFRVLRVA